MLAAPALRHRFSIAPGGMLVKRSRVALRREGAKKMSRRVRKMIKILDSLLHYDVPYLGGGNEDKVIAPPGDVRIASNQAGITGGIRLWECQYRTIFFSGGRQRQRGVAAALEGRAVEIRAGAFRCGQPREIDHGGDFRLRRQWHGIESATFLGAYGWQRSRADGAAGGLARTNAACA
jgi:hypothetical protein